MSVPGSGRTFRVSVVSPQRTLFEGPARFLVVPAHDGELGILYGHAPLMALLGEGSLRVKTDGGTRHFRVSRGFVQVIDNEASVLSEDAVEIGGR